MSGLREAAWYKPLGGGVVKCTLCPRGCVLKPEQVGYCRVRENRGGKLYTLVYGLVSSMAIDPIEKKPLFNFYPGAPIFSVSTVGCNFHCPWCQNWQISQVGPRDLRLDYVEPERLIGYMKEYGVPFIAFTYNEPIIWYEYVLDVSKLAKKEGFKVVLVTNGHINLEPLEELLPYVDAANVDIKAFKAETYAKYPGGKLEAVLEATKAMKERGVHVETTYLVIPGVNDDESEFRSLIKWQMDELGPETPLHISRFFPMYRFTDRPPTPIETIERFWLMAREEGLLYVYTGNIPGHAGEHTYCPGCGRPVIRRAGFEIYDWRIDDSNACKFCGEKVHIVGHRWRATP